MLLKQLLKNLDYTLVQGCLNTEVTDIYYDSRKVTPGGLFVCIVGTQRDSHDYAADVAAKGAAVLAIQHDLPAEVLAALPDVTVVKFESTRYAMALLSTAYFGRPALEMTMVGVTGTKGKTTTTHMIKSVLEAAGRKVGMIGTNGIYYMGRHKDTANTTPESYELQKTFRQFLDAGCDVALMEVSSQGLMMDRVAGAWTAASRRTAVSDMEDIYKIAANGGISDAELKDALKASLTGRTLKKVLIIPPDFTRFHSQTGRITSIYYHLLTERGAQVDIMPALGTHEPVSKAQWEIMFKGIPYENMIVHDWRHDVVKIGEVPASYLEEITEGLWHEPVSVEINRRVMDENYDLIISPGQVVPHEVIGMANHSKNLFVGVGGSDMINKSHMVGAVYGMERMMGKDHTPVRKIFDYGMEHFLNKRPILFVLTVCTAPEGESVMHGLFIGEGRSCLTEAVKLAQEKNIDFVEHGIQKCVVYLDPSEFKSTWLGNKAVYRTRMAIADGGELIILAPGVTKFGEDVQVDKLIRKYGYKGRLHTLDEFNKPENQDLRDNMGAAAHLIHGSSDGRFSITYAVKEISQQEIKSVGFRSASYDELAKKYDPEKLHYGYNTVDGEEIYYIPNPALGLWINREKFEG